MQRALPLLLLVSTACAASGPPVPEQVPVVAGTAKVASCIEKEIAVRGQAPIVVRFLLDESGNVASSEDQYDDVLMTFQRAHTGRLLSYELKQRGVTTIGKFSFGKRGELTSLRISSTDGRVDAAAELEWQGTFAQSSGTTLPFAALGGPGGANDERLRHVLSSNLNVRHGSNAMAPVSFTGTVTVKRASGRETYEYDAGRLQRWHHEDKSHASYVWDDGPLPVEQQWCDVDGPLEPRCGSARRTRLPGGGARETIEAAGASIVVDYDASNRIVRGGGAANNDSVSWHECQSFKPPRSP